MGAERPVSWYAAHSQPYKASQACPGMPPALDIARMARGRGQTASPWGTQGSPTLTTPTAASPSLLVS